MDAEPRELTSFVADTHALFWYLIGSERLGEQAKVAFDAASKGEAIIFVPAIVLAELYFLNEKAGGVLNFSDEYKKLRESGMFVFVPFEPDDVADFEQDKKVLEMHDRMIVGVARRMGATCITVDRDIVSSGLVATVW